MSPVWVLFQIFLKYSVRLWSKVHSYRQTIYFGRPTVTITCYNKHVLEVVYLYIVSIQFYKHHYIIQKFSILLHISSNIYILRTSYTTFMSMSMHTKKNKRKKTKKKKTRKKETTNILSDESFLCIFLAKPLCLACKVLILWIGVIFYIITVNIYYMYIQSLWVFFAHIII